MLPDHYATLGVAPNSSRGAIRAAYLELMRRYHPDKNPSPAAAELARAITAAYAVLATPHRRAFYDEQRAQRPRRRTVLPKVAVPRPPLTSWAPLALGIGAIPLLLWLVVPGRQEPVQPPVRPSAIATSHAVALPAATLIAERPNPGSLCSSPAVARPIKRELFRRAASLRGGDVAPFAAAADASQLRLVPRGAGDRRAGAIQCQVAVQLDLPPASAGRGQSRRVTGTLRFNLRTAEVGGGSISGLTTEAPLVARLARSVATTTAAMQPAAPAVAPSATPPVSVPLPPAPSRPMAIQPSPVPPRPAPPSNPPRSAQYNPSFSCNGSLTWAANAICRSPSLAALDRQTARIYGDAIQRANRPQMLLLRQSDLSFVARRNACSSQSCIQGAYAGQIREIQSVMAGGARPPR